MKEYLEWEVALVEALEKDGSLTFRHFDQNKGSKLDGLLPKSNYTDSPSRRLN
jgi:hypothetical protein